MINSAFIRRGFELAKGKKNLFPFSGISQNIAWKLAPSPNSLWPCASVIAYLWSLLAKHFELKSGAQRSLEMVESTENLLRGVKGIGKRKKCFARFVSFMKLECCSGHQGSGEDFKAREENTRFQLRAGLYTHTIHIRDLDFGRIKETGLLHT